jgi:clan AA aspartic protease (TIGR02281 family)
MSYIVVTSARDREASGRSIASALAGVGISLALLIVRPGMGVPVPITGPPAMPDPVTVPGGGHPGGGGHRLLIPADAHGSCYVSASVNGALFNHMLLDSGAAGDHLVFGRNHAARLGFDPDTLSYDDTYGSANGTGHEAVVTLREFRIGSFVLHDVPAAITEKALFAPLVAVGILHRLGMRLIDGHCELRLP